MTVPRTLTEWLSIAGMMVPVVIALWAVLRFLLTPFWVWQHRHTGKKAFQAELAEFNAFKELAAQLNSDVQDLRSAMEQQREVLESIPSLADSARRSAEACERTERSIEVLGERMFHFTKELGTLQGAQAQLSKLSTKE